MKLIIVTFSLAFLASQTEAKEPLLEQNSTETKNSIAKVASEKNHNDSHSIDKKRAKKGQLKKHYQHDRQVKLYNHVPVSGFSKHERINRSKQFNYTSWRRR